MRRLTSAILASALLTPVLAAAPAEAASARRIGYTQWDTGAALRTGALDGVRVRAGRVSLVPGVDAGRWASPWTAAGFALTRLIASWSARTPGDSRLKVEVRGRSGTRTSSWDTLALWASDDRYLRRTTSSGQSDDLGSVNVDTWVVPGGVTSYQLRVRLSRAAGQAGSPSVDTIGAVSSLLPDVSDFPTSRPGVARGVVLDVPRYSQMIHRGQNPEFGGGGEAWCSPTSLSMLLGYYGRLPGPRSYAWVKRSYADRWVNQVARMTYDYRYRGTGNWPFNTAAAATRLPDTFVTRLTDLRMAESFLRAGIPLAVSIRFSRGGLTGAPISATAGHLVVLAGLTATGDPIVMDPAAPTDATVRRTYDRAQFERAWLGGSGGTAYVVRDAAHPLPARPAGVRAW